MHSVVGLVCRFAIERLGLAAIGTYSRSAVFVDLADAVFVRDIAPRGFQLVADGVVPAVAPSNLDDGLVATATA